MCKIKWYRYDRVCDVTEVLQTEVTYACLLRYMDRWYAYITYRGTEIFVSHSVYLPRPFACTVSKMAIFYIFASHSMHDKHIKFSSRMYVVFYFGKGKRYKVDMELNVATNIWSILNGINIAHPLFNARMQYFDVTEYPLTGITMEVFQNSLVTWFRAFCFPRSILTATQRGPRWTKHNWLVVMLTFKDNMFLIWCFLIDIQIIYGRD